MSSLPGAVGGAGGQEPIAIVGMGCRWPGNVKDASGLWELLKNKRSGYRDFGDHRFQRKGFHHSNPDHPGTVATEGAFLLAEDPRLFDHAFFGIGSLEVETMDPSQRKLLEVVYEAFENAGESWESFSGSSTGVFVGNFSSDHLIIQGRDTDHPRPYASVGTGTSILSNRVNYIFNLRGPSVTLDTACSSSMYALHLAVTAIRNGDCDSAIVAASNTIMDPSTQLMMGKLGVLSPTSTSHTFDSSADGYARGEGFAALYLKKTPAAVEGDYPIRAFIRGTALNANGRTGGITHPSREGQEAVIRKAYETSGLALEDTTYFECHGTGTPVGDPIEVSAIGSVFAPFVTKEKPLLVGSIKTNIGHTEPASAIAGIMKVVLALEEGFIPPSIGVRELNPNLDLKNGKIEVVVENTAWPEGRLRRASVNSFGYGGANGHCIIDHVNNCLPEYKQVSPPSRSNMTNRISFKSNGTNGTNGTEAHNGHPARHHQANRDNHHQNGNQVSPAILDSDHSLWSLHYPFSQRAVLVSDAAATTRRLVLLPFSAHNEASLNLNVAAMSESIPKHHSLADVAYTLAARRTRFIQRTFRIVGSQINQSSGAPWEEMTTPEPVWASGTQIPRLGFIFTGQGAQWHAMGADLFEYRVFRTSIQYLDSLLQRLPTPPSWKIEDILAGRNCDADTIQKAEVSQTVCTAVQVSLVDLLDAWNIKPSAVVGHSSGEIAAAYASGRLTAAEAIAVAYLRGQAISLNRQKGRMLAVGLGPDEVEEYLVSTDTAADVKLAAINSPNSVTLSGELGAIGSISAKLTEHKVFNRALQTGGNAYHSHHMLALGNKYVEFLSKGFETVRSLGQAETQQHYTTCPWYSSVYPAKESPRSIEPSYWKANLESPVLFSEALYNMLNATASDQQMDLLLEIGPHPALKGPVADIMKSVGRTVPYFSTLKRNENSQLHMLRLAGGLFGVNADVNLAAVNSADHLLPPIAGQQVQNQGTDAAQLSSTLRFICGRATTHLPPYQYAYGPVIYHESRFSKEFRSRPVAHHDLLGSKLPGNAKLRPQWRNMIRLMDVPWLQDHKLLPYPVFPAAAYIAMAVEAAARICNEQSQPHTVIGFYLQNVSFSSAMRIPEDDLGLEIVTSMELVAQPAGVEGRTEAADDTWASFSISSVARESPVWTEHCSGRVKVATQGGQFEPSERLSVDMDARTVDTRSWYEKFAELGLGYGPTFQPLSNIQADPALNLAVAQVAMQTTRDTQVHGGESKYPTIHPASLDAVFQLSLVASHGGQTDRARNAFVPVHIDQLYVKNGLGGEQGPEWATAIARGELKGLRSAHARLQVLDQSDEVVLDIRNLRCVSYTDTTPATAGGFGRGAFSSPFFRLTWKPDVRALAGEQARRHFPPPQENVAKIHLFDKLDRLGTLFVAEIYEHFVKPDRFSAAPRHIGLFLSWVRRRMEIDENKWVTEANRMTSPQRHQVIDEMLLEVGGNSDVKVAKAVFDNIEDILCERKTGLDVVLKDGLLDGMYDDGLIMTGAYPQLVAFFDLLGHANPNMKVLEIGAGTAGATRRIIKILTGANGIKRYQDYTFTDISSGFLSQARNEFSEHRDVKYSVLNIEENPLENGYGADYDVVVACECLHATKSIAKTLANCRKLLKPGGRLVIVENTRAVIGHGLVLGHLSGYWDGIPDGRVDSPFLHLEGWNSSLNKTGFSGAEVVLDDYPAPYTTARLIVSTALEDGEVTAAAQDQYEDHSCVVDQATTSVEKTAVVHLVHGQGGPSTLLQRVETELQMRGTSTKRLSMDEATGVLPANCRAIAFADGDALLVKASTEQLEIFKTLVRNSASMIWLTSCGTVSGDSPDAAITTGLLRTVGTENPTSRYFSLDVSPGSNMEDQNLVRSIVDQEASLQDREAGESRDYEAVWQHGCLWTSRLIPDTQLQMQLELAQGAPNRAEMRPLDSQGYVRAAFETPGILTSLYFKTNEEACQPLLDDWIQVKVAAVGLNWKDLLTSIGRFDMNTFSSEYSGVVDQIGSGVTNVAVGDRVYGYGRGHFGNYVRAPARFSYRLLPDDDLIKMASIPLVGMTAVYAFEHVTCLRKSERVLIQSATGGLGLAAIQLARFKGADVFATAGTAEKRRYLTDVEGIPASHVFSSRDAADIPRLIQATGGKGFDVILGTASGDLLHDSFKMLAPMGRFVDVGRQDVQKSMSLGLELFQKNATFTSFDLAVADDLDPTLGPALMEAVDNHFRAGQMRPLSSITTFDVSQLDQALLSFSKGTHIGKLVITFQNPESLVRMVPAAPRATFDRRATYIITGGLGGLGRSIVNFMSERGARHFSVLSRSRTITPEARLLIDRLAISGVTVNCIACDVSIAEEVTRTIREIAADRTIKGLVHAAVSYQDLSFDKLTIDQWTSGLAAKVQGTKNLHEATKSHAGLLDFFVMTTSIETVVALATQGAYTAANNFQDYFARWRHAQGLPASTASFGLINDVGHLSTNSTTLALMARNKVLPVTEYQFLRLLEPAFMDTNGRGGRGSNMPAEASSSPLLPPPGHTGAQDDAMSITNFITCFDPAVMAARKRAEEAGNINANAGGSSPRWYTDARVSLVMRAFQDADRHHESAMGGGPGGGGNTTSAASASQTLRREFDEAVKSLMSREDTQDDGKGATAGVGTPETPSRADLDALVTDAIVKTIAQMLFIDASGVDASRNVANYGVDSLIAAELRNWFNVAFGADISMLELLDTSSSIRGLASSIVNVALER